MSFYSKWITLQLKRNQDVVNVDVQTLRRIRDRLDDLEKDSKELKSIKDYLEQREANK